MTLATAFLSAARSVGIAAFALTTLVTLTAQAADYPAPKESSAVLKNFRFNTGEVMPELRINYVTVGEPSGEPVLILHGTTGSGRGMLNPASEANCSARANRWMRAAIT